MKGMDYAPFDGDGRVMLRPTITLPATAPMEISRSMARMLVRNYVRHGYSNHSALAGTLWVIIQWCQTQGKPYKLTACPRFGYRVEPYEDAHEPTR